MLKMNAVVVKASPFKMLTRSVGYILEMVYLQTDSANTDYFIKISDV